MRLRRTMHARGLVLALLSWTLLAAEARAQVALEGRVLTTTGEAVTDAVVSVAALRLRAAVDEEGRFSFPALPLGTYLVEAVSPRHGRGVARVEARGDGPVELEIVLERVVHSEEIVVTASPIGRSQLEVATPTTVLSGDELALRIEPSLGETLAHEPGVTSTYFGPGASRPVIRGLGGDRVRMMESGLDVLDASSTSPDHAVASDPLAAERIEVLRGPATLLYGSNAIGGAVNVLDERIPSYRPSEPVSGTVDLRGGSVADERAAALRLGGGGGRWAWHMDALKRETDDYEIPGRAEVAGLDEGEEDEHAEEEAVGVLANSDIETEAGAVGASYFFGDAGFLGVSLRGFDTNYGVPGGDEHAEEEGEPGAQEMEEEEEEGGIRIDLQQRRVDLQSEVFRPFGVFRGARIRVGVVDYEHQEIEPSGEVGTSFFNDAWEGRLELVQKERGRLSGAVGVQVRRRELEAVGEEAFIPPTQSDTYAVFAFEEWARDPVTYQFGLRFERQDSSADVFGLPDRSFDGLSGSFGLVWNATETWAVAASVARSVKLPNSEELYSEGLHFATQSFEQGNPNLEEETSLGLDLSLRRQRGRLTGEVNLFWNRFDEFIFQAFTGEEVEGLPVLLYTQADVEFRGAEARLRIVLHQHEHHHLDVELLGDLVRAELTGSGEPLPRIPPARYGVGLHYGGDRLSAEVEVRRVENQDRLAENETPTDGYELVSASLGYRFFFGDQVLDLFLRGRNLTDEEARNHVSFLKDRVPLPGRDVSLGVRLSF